MTSIDIKLSGVGKIATPVTATVRETHDRWQTLISTLADFSDDQLAAVDIGEANLRMAFGLPGAEKLNVVVTV
jgi:hypothetical protein